VLTKQTASLSANQFEEHVAKSENIRFHLTAAYRTGRHYARAATIKIAVGILHLRRWTWCRVAIIGKM
jgi:hypothetical protein